MANATQAWTNLNSHITILTNVLEQLNEDQDMLASDSGLATLVAAVASQRGWTLSAADITAAAAAINQLLFAFNSGNPVNKVSLYKLL